nr:YccF domain-containing protein [Streptomonospora sp. PA3]
MLRLLLNVVWLVVAGLWLALGYVLAGVVCCLLVITIPFGVASFRMAAYALWPFGRELARRPGSGGASTLLNVVWLIVAGWWLALGHIATAVGLAVTVIGIPLAWASLKMIPVALAPFGNEIVPSDGPRDPWRF